MGLCAVISQGARGRCGGLFRSDRCGAGVAVVGGRGATQRVVVQRYVLCASTRLLASATGRAAHTTCSDCHFAAMDGLRRLPTPNLELVPAFDIKTGVGCGERGMEGGSPVSP
jgi:hypothetical protein